ncbi:hypothetical protein DACRYDRAFT_116119 [Dacryopinax primogenitus]|uniref:RING-type domain-containing protein n=1 Tax=Dacryopinax primogenitus (strain DJM 731) TaxID=1858805 RepID=M5GDI6_DACPD|nr:uncharacterized protein DACRYDRAFT_116119 [Dacryopinax primogenitus]EJU02433.1 hypothetical protein DACRYDRAFT_116119 [Dacryopinax primogenitus]
MDGSVRGMPLIADDAPAQGDDNECHRCGKGFVPLIVRSRRCAHCGYAYCHSCSENQALKQRVDHTGYEPVNVCAYCMDNLTLTTFGRNQLKQQSIAKLKAYLAAYGIAIPPGVAEKSDLVDLVLSARTDGFMPAQMVRYYRRHSIPIRQGDRSGRRPSATSTQGSGTGGGFSFSDTLEGLGDTIGGLFTGEGGQGDRRPRPPPQQQQQRRPPPPSPPRQQQQRPSPRPPPQQQQQRYAPPPGPPPPRQTRPPPRPPSQPPPLAPTSTPAPVRPPTPTMDELVSLPAESLGSLSISALKGVLEHNHVNTHLLVEKADLVLKVRTLVEQEKRERARIMRVHELEEEQERLRESEMEEIRRAEAASRETHEQERRATAEATRTVTEGHPGVIIEVESPDSPTSTPNQESQPARSTDHLAASLTPEEAASIPLPQSPLVTPSLSPTPVPPKADPLPTTASDAGTRHKKSQSGNVDYDLSLIGRCVVCQDEEANIALVDCGHLALCMPCSDLIMKSTRECPLCRTRIVTEQRLLRIYRT